jgi:multidrug efflux pump subunit AcrA (membrane-fusion protein)
MNDKPIAELEAAREALKTKLAATEAQVEAKLAPARAKLAELERQVLSYYLDNEQLDQAISLYIATRDEKEAVAKQQKETNGAFAFTMNRIENWFLKYFDRTGQTSAGVKTAGTAARSTRRKVSVADPDIFFRWVISNDVPEMLEKRASKKAVEAYMESGNELPPGLNTETEYTVQITRPRSR